MKHLIRVFSIVIIVLFVSIISSFSQTKYISVSESSSINVFGTSNLHDWDMNVNNFTCSFFTDKESLRESTITGVSFSCRVEDIDSDNSIMNSKTHKALKKEEFPVIKFTFISQRELLVTDSNVKGVIIGLFDIAGQQKQMPISFTGNINPDKSVTISGKLSFMMSEFGIDPPKAMFGALKTGDKITMEFNFAFINK